MFTSTLSPSAESFLLAVFLRRFHLHFELGQFVFLQPEQSGVADVDVAGPCPRKVTWYSPSGMVSVSSSEPHALPKAFNFALSSFTFDCPAR